MSTGRYHLRHSIAIEDVTIICRRDYFKRSIPYSSPRKPSQSKPSPNGRLHYRIKNTPNYCISTQPRIIYARLLCELENTSWVPVEEKSSVCLICMKYRIILIIIIISLSEISLSYRILQTHHSSIHAHTGGHARALLPRTHTNTSVAIQVRWVGGTQA